MKMDELINELRDMYQDGDNKELFEETVDFFDELYNKSETIRELVDDNDIEALSKSLINGYSSYLGQYNACTNRLIDLCYQKDYTKIAKYIMDTCEELTKPGIDLTKEENIGKIKMVSSFYKDINNNNFSNIFEFVNNCRLINNLCLIINNYKTYLINHITDEKKKIK